jgi:hypothetical protein
VQWAIEFWLSSERRTTVLYGAVLLPHDVFARLSISQIMHEVKAAAMTCRLLEELETAQ